MLYRMIVVVVCGMVVAFMQIAGGMVEPESQIDEITDSSLDLHPLEPLPADWHRTEIHKVTRIKFPTPTETGRRRFYWDQSEMHGATRLEGESIIVAWMQRRRSGLRPLFIEQCVVVTHEKDGHWNIAIAFRHPASHNQGPGCHSHYWSLGGTASTDCIRYRSKRFNFKPSNEDVYRMLNEIDWQFESMDDFEIVDGAVLPSAWQMAFGEPPRKLVQPVTLR